MKLSEFIIYVRNEVNDEVVKTTCPLCYHLESIATNHKCDWKPFYHVFKDKPEYLISHMVHHRDINPIPTINQSEGV